jgi:hypothetical protein
VEDHTRENKVFLGWIYGDGLDTKPIRVLTRTDWIEIKPPGEALRRCVNVALD